MNNKPKVEEVRGEIINKAVILEAFLDSLIVEHFCGTTAQKRDLTYAILSKEKVMMSFKAEIVGFILSNYFPEFIEDYPKYISELQSVIDTRNLVAHRLFVEQSDLTGERKQYLHSIKTKRQKMSEDIVEVNTEFVSTFNKLFSKVYEQTDIAYNLLMNKKAHR
jgi:hypothetical protein